MDFLALLKWRTQLSDTPTLKKKKKLGKESVKLREKRKEREKQSKPLEPHHIGTSPHPNPFSHRLTATPPGLCQTTSPPPCRDSAKSPELRQQLNASARRLDAATPRGSGRSALPYARRSDLRGSASASARV